MERNEWHIVANCCKLAQERLADAIAAMECAELQSMIAQWSLEQARENLTYFNPVEKQKE